MSDQNASSSESDEWCSPEQADDTTQRVDDVPSRESMASAECGPLDVTIDSRQAPSKAFSVDAQESEESIPEDLSMFQSSVLETESKSVGRYQIERKLGAGGFGQVLLATDQDLQRRVAIKIPFKERIAKPGDIQKFLDEARVVALLDHPGVVPIYDFGRFEDRCFVVSKYIEGGTLSDRMRDEGLSLELSVEMLRTLAKTLDFIHQSGVVHRDIKPANILLDEHSHCYLTDFGLAIHDNSMMRMPGRVGTVAYMSPEQARGESHLVDGRSDLFSLGVLMYELLAGERPFVGENWQQTLEKICKDDPKTLRECDPSVPKELERICLKLLSKRAGARYDTAGELADDLEYVQAHGVELSFSKRLVDAESQNAQMIESADQLVGIVPRGLRCFDQADADYFRKLLPGPCDRSGLPDSLHFWKRRIETESSLEAFRIGVIYGSSGSGKSSFAKAGLLPILSDDIVRVTVDASADHTETQLLAALRAAIPDLPDTLALVESLSWIRTHDLNLPGRKVLIVIDQFEQWLHSWGGNASAVLTLALRQCDAVTLQCILLVRDDYWVGVSRFAELSDVDLVRSENLAMIDLFDKRHARKVLAEYGRGYSRLKGNLNDLTSDQNAFLDQAIDGLASDGKIIPVQLVTFAEIMKSRPWSVRSIEGIGGIEGVGIRFLDEALGTNAPAENRLHVEAVQRVLKSLLPEAGSNIKGSMRSEQELSEIAGYEDQPRRFGQMISILDKDLRLITPTDHAESTDQTGETSERFFQLSHDFLVPAIRHWLQRNQRLTMRGRAALRLADRADVWTSRSESGHLPSWVEWLTFLTLTKSSRWDVGERRLMKAASQKHLLSTAAGAALLLAALWWGFDKLGRSRTEGLTQQLATATPAEAKGVLNQLAPVKGWSREPLEELERSYTIDTSPGLRARLALLRINPTNETRLEELCDEVFDSDLQHLPLIRDELAELHPRLPELIERLWKVAEDTSQSPARRLNAGFVLATCDPPIADKNGQLSPSSRWREIQDAIAETIVNRTIEFPSEYPLIVDAFKQVPEAIWTPLLRMYRSPLDVEAKEEPANRRRTRNLIVDLAQENPSLLVAAFLDGDHEQVRSFLPTLDKLPKGQLWTEIEQAFVTSPDASQSAEAQQRISNRQVNAAALALRHGDHLRCWALLKHHPIPSTRSGLIERAALLGVNPRLLLDRLRIEEDPGIRSALFLMLGTVGSDRLSKPERGEAIGILKDAFLSSPHADVHSSAIWALNQMGDKPDAQWIVDQQERLAETSRPADFGWNLGAMGQPMIRFPRDAYTLEIGAHEVIYQDFRTWRPHFELAKEHVAGDRSPVGLATWYDAVAFCRWLTRQEGLTEADQCHPANFRDAETLSLHEDYLQRRGYRLLTAQEWEAACFGDATTRLPMGHSDSLVRAYGWVSFTDLPMQPAVSKKPLPNGMFGMLGNVAEWCSPIPGVNAEKPVRGPKWNTLVNQVVSKCREGFLPASTKFFTMGFRICRVVPLENQ